MGTLAQCWGRGCGGWVSEIMVGGRPVVHTDPRVVKGAAASRFKTTVAVAAQTLPALSTAVVITVRVVAADDVDLICNTTHNNGQYSLTN